MIQKTIIAAALLLASTFVVAQTTTSSSGTSIVGGAGSGLAGPTTSTPGDLASFIDAFGRKLQDTGIAASTLARTNQNNTFTGTNAFSSSTTVNGKLLCLIDGTNCPASNPGTVTSVALSMPGVIFNNTVPGSPITSSGTFAPTLATQVLHTYLAGPCTGSSATPTFRTICAADLPVFGASGTNHAAGAVPDPGSSAGTAHFLREDGNWTLPTDTAQRCASACTAASSVIFIYTGTNSGGSISFDGTIPKASVTCQETSHDCYVVASTGYTQYSGGTVTATLVVNASKTAYFVADPVLKKVYETTTPF